MADASSIRQQILDLVKEYSSIVHKRSFPGNEYWVEGDSIPYAGRVFDYQEVQALVESSLDFWLTLGPNGNEFESRFSTLLGVQKCLLTNSGSSANLLAFSALKSHLLPPERRLTEGDEVITVACGFPTTVTPIIQNGCVPVFVDIDPHTLNISVDYLDQAYNPGVTKAIVLAHGLGNPFDLASILAFCRKNSLWLIEDNCDALGSTYTMPMHISEPLGFTESSPGLSAPPGFITRYTGTWGDISTQSFYPPHHLTLGEGGLVSIRSSSRIAKAVESIRDWGRDCWCPSGVDNTCHKRFDWSLGDLPTGYDHKYIYSHLGYNLKPLDLQAAIGLVQLDRLSEFTSTRVSNWRYLYTQLAALCDYFDFSMPTHASSLLSDGSYCWTDDVQTNPSWFGFMLLVRTDSPFSRRDLSQYLDTKGIGHRMFFGGNLTRQPAFVQLLSDRPGSYRSIGNLENSDLVMNQGLFLGTYPGMTKNMIDYIVTSISSFVHSFS